MTFQSVVVTTKINQKICKAELLCYSLVSNRRGGWNSRGLEKISKINSRGVGIIGGVGKNLSDSHFLYIVTVRL